jgi:hypothetical protein
MWNDLADGENEIEVTSCYEAVNLGRPGIAQFAFRLFLNELSGNFAKRFHVGAPAMNVKEPLRDVAEHVSQLIRAHRGVRSECGKHRLEAVTVILPRKVGQVAGAGVLAALIRRDGEDAIARAEFGERIRKQLLQLLPREICFGASN